MLSRTLALAVGLTAGLAASQAPEFSQQYRQRLGGAIDELQTVVGRFDQDARQYGLDRSAAIARLSGNVDPLAQKRAQDARLNAERLEELVTQRNAMTEAGPFKRVFVMMSDPDPAVLRGTVGQFEPAVPAHRRRGRHGGGGPGRRMGLRAAVRPALRPPTPRRGAPLRAQPSRRSHCIRTSSNTRPSGSFMARGSVP